MLYRGVVVGVALMIMSIQPALTVADIVGSAEQAIQTVAVRDVISQNGEVSGEIVNYSPRTLRDVELLVRHVWHWKNEFRPADDNPGMASYYTVVKEIPAGESMPFNYAQLSPLPSRADGQFETMVSVAGFTEVIPQ
jgi:hypothetical protein